MLLPNKVLQNFALEKFVVKENALEKFVVRENTLEKFVIGEIALKCHTINMQTVRRWCSLCLWSNLHICTFGSHVCTGL